MSDKNKQTIKQRDQFLAFALASADLLIEVSKDGLIDSVIGAPQLLTGIKESELIGEEWLNIFSAYDQTQLQKLHKNSIAGRRCGPIIVEINGPDKVRKGVFTGIKMPNSKSFFITLGLGNKVMTKLAAESTFSSEKELSDHPAFIAEADKAFDFARSLDQDPSVTLFDFGFSEEIMDEFNDEQWGAFQEELTSFLQSKSLNGTNPGKFDDSKYGIIHDEDPDLIISEAKHIAEKYLPEDSNYSFEDETVQADLSEIGDWEAEKALDYLVTGFTADNEEESTEITTLSQSIKAHTAYQEGDLQELKDIINRVDFDLRFQPVKNLGDQEVLHFEILPHFKKGDARKWLMLVEDADLTFEFDIAFCERAINHISFKLGGSRTKFSISVFTASIQNPEFLEKLKEKLDSADNIADRICFEIKHFHQIVDFNAAKKLTTELSGRGHELCVSGINPSPASIKKLRSFNLRFIKIGNKTIHDVADNIRTQSNLKELASKCNYDAVPLIACDINNEDKADTLHKLGILYGQGSHIGEPSADVGFQPTQS